MIVVDVNKPKTSINRLIKKVSTINEPVFLSGRQNAVLLSEQDWRAISETLYLQSITGMTESIKKGLKTPINECSESLKW
ncbi:type II toxin-antitoxin system prevent-host-death family antitoxin [Candidatus Dependentiae bacterium]|nr:type II toxin-antitoxin system prevent-host-death family antitoxin [Candidatus Dependentiae bacterium]